MTRAARLPVFLTLLVLGGALLSLSPTPARADEKVVVTLWTWRPDASVVGEMVAAISLAHPDIDLRAVVQPADTYFAALRAAAAAGTLPDIIGLPAGAETQRIRDQLQDVSKPADQILGKQWRKHFPDEVLAEATLGNPKGDDNFYILPMTAEVLGFWFDRPAFGKAGLTAPPASLEDMARDAEKLHGAGVAPLALGGATDPALIGLFLEIAAQTDLPDLQAAEGGQPVWTRPGMVRAASAWQVLFGKVAGPDALTTDAQAAAAQFAQGKAAMSPQGSSWLRQARQPSATDKPGEATLSDYGPFAFPAVSPGGPPSPPLGGVAVGWGVTRNANGSPEVERASHIVLRELVVGAGAATAVDELTGLPANKDLTPHRPLSTDVRRLYDTFRAQLATAKPHVIGDPAIHDVLVAHLRAVAGGHEAPAEAMAAVDAAARARQVLAR